MIQDNYGDSLYDLQWQNQDCSALSGDDNHFTGLPASASTIFIIITAFLQIEILYILVFIVFLSLVMISNIRFPKLGTKIEIIATVLIFLTIIIGDLYNNIAPILLFIAIAIYAVVGPIYIRFLQKR